MNMTNHFQGIFSQKGMLEPILNLCMMISDYLEPSFVSGCVQKRISDPFPKIKVQKC